MKKFEATCLEEAYELATSEFECSITDLDIDIIQQPSKGFLGFGKKNAIITASSRRRRRDNRRPKEQKFRKKILKLKMFLKK